IAEMTAPVWAVMLILTHRIEMTSGCQGCTWFAIRLTRLTASIFVDMETVRAWLQPLQFRRQLGTTGRGLDGHRADPLANTLRTDPMHLYLHAGGSSSGKQQCSAHPCSNQPHCILLLEPSAISS